MTYSLKVDHERQIFEKLFIVILFHSYGVFFSTKKCALYSKKNSMLCLFLKMFRPLKRVVCFILNNLHFPMVEGIAFYTLHKLRVLIIPCKAEDFCLFIALPDEI